MAFNNDYLLRQIEDMAQFLGKVLFIAREEEIPVFDEEGNIMDSGILYGRLRTLCSDGAVNEAENLLFDTLEENHGLEYLRVAMRFYTNLDQWSDDELAKANFSRDEILEGLSEVQDRWVPELEQELGQPDGDDPAQEPAPGQAETE